LDAGLILLDEQSEPPSRPVKPSIDLDEISRRSKRENIVRVIAGVVVLAVVVGGVRLAEDYLLPAHVVVLPSDLGRQTSSPNGTGVTPVVSSKSLLVTGDVEYTAQTGFSAAFSQDSAPLAAGYADRWNRATKGDGNLNAILPDEVAKGGYALDGLIAGVIFQAQTSQSVLVNNVYPIIVKRGAPVSGAIIDYQGAAPPIDTVLYNLDQPNYVPKNSADNKPYFLGHSITVKQGDNPDVDKETLKFLANAGAYDFKVAVDFQVGDRQFTTYVQRPNNGGDLVLRASGALCKPGSYAQVFARGDILKDPNADQSHWSVTDPSGYVPDECAAG
jgi:hypothetical protein